MRTLIFIQVLFILTACSQRDKSETNKLECKEQRFDNFKICIPTDWKQAKITAYDSKVLLFINEKDSIVFDNHGVDLSDNPIIVDSEKEKQTMLEFSNHEIDSQDINVYKNKDFDNSNAVFHKNYYYYDTINKIDVLMVFPKKEKGTIAAFFNKNSDKNKLSIYCTNPSEKTKSELKKVFNSVTRY